MQSSQTDLLLAAGSNPHIRDDEPLHVAAINGHIEIVKLLFTKNCKFHYKTLYEVAKNGHLDVLKLLHATKSNCDMDDSYFKSNDPFFILNNNN